MVKTSIEKGQQCSEHQRSPRAQANPSALLMFAISKGTSFHSATVWGKSEYFSIRFLFFFLVEMVLTAGSVSVLSGVMTKKKAFVFNDAEFIIYCPVENLYTVLLLVSFRVKSNPRF